MKNKKNWQRVLCLLLILAMLPITGFASDVKGMDAFTLPDVMPELPFTDVSASAWYYGYVEAVYALGLMVGVDETTFGPNSVVPLTQGIAVAVRIYEKYQGIADGFEGYAGPWYQYYVDRAMEYGMLPDSMEDADLDRAATRAELAVLLYRSLPVEALEPILPVDTIPDYTEADPHWEAVITLYRAGILIGDEYGRFMPHTSIRRSELAAMLTRLVRMEYRITELPNYKPIPIPPPLMDAFTLPDPLPEMPFSDVPQDKWYYSDVHISYALSLMSGMGGGRFAPDGTVLIGQTVAVAVRVYERYNGIPDESAAYERPWYLYYMERAKSYGILTGQLADASPTRPATRAEVAAILVKALPAGELGAINTVTELPDYDSSDLYWGAVVTLYQAGVLIGDDSYGTFRPDSPIRRSELAAILIRLVRPETRKHFTLEEYLPVTMESIVYGYSGAGRELMAYRYGDGENVMVLTFAIHGWEDNFSRDGQMLVDTAALLREALEEEYEIVIRPNEWSVYVLPCLNPDGLYDGWTHNGPGRCTTHSFDKSGSNAYGQGVDLNRCFPYSFSASWSDRYYTGSQPLQAREAVALADFVEEVMGAGHNVLIDAHGWYAQTIVSGGRSSEIYLAFEEFFPANTYASLYGGSGYFSSWAAYALGYDACLFEFPAVYSASAFCSAGYAQKYVDSILYILEAYG